MSKTAILVKKSLFSPEKRDQILQEFDASGLSAAEFSKRSGIHWTTLYKWIRTGKKVHKNAPQSMKETQPTLSPSQLPATQSCATLEQVPEIAAVLAENEVLKAQMTRLQNELDEYQRVLGQSLFEARRRRAA